MNKDDLISKLSSDVSLSKVDAAKIVDSIFNSIANALKRGDNVVTSGGIVGKIERVMEEDKVEVSIADGITVQVVKSTIQSLVTQTNTKK